MFSPKIEQVIVSDLPDPNHLKTGNVNIIDQLARKRTVHYLVTGHA